MKTLPQFDEAILAQLRLYIRPPRLGGAATSSMSALVAETSRLPLNRLEQWERLIRDELWAAKHGRGSSRWFKWPSAYRASPWLELCSGDGFLREKALRNLSEGAPNTFFFLLALRRLNDWVPQVRAAAREHLPTIASKTTAEQLTDAFWVTLPSALSWGRLGGEDWQTLMNLLSSEPVALALKNRIVDAGAGPAGRVLAQAGRTAALDRWLDEIARSAKQPAVRAKAYRFIFEARWVWVTGTKWTWLDIQWCKGRFEPVIAERQLSCTYDSLQLLRSALLDVSPMVRRVGGEFLIKWLDSVGPEAGQWAKRLAEDASPTVAERGRFALAKLGGQA